ncbi:MAG TPA: Asp-tRNA(Asn)/Glu-tRNA(Gln) amidotransferase subunit GatB, partial [Candidatus Hydrogenedentes bacterium]|nr:Asp-tRNA(Asn)/Glu-tRNA(Gln) amidotransferase subunit GatB [Candidatus Hydrogenedentota bacterium]
EANVSVRPVGSDRLGTKTEIKNVASFSGVQKAIDYEIRRQVEVIRSGGTIIQETRGWDPDRGITFSQRAKESAHDYRYFPEPDLVPIVVDEDWEQRIRQRLPEFPADRRKRFITQYGLSAYDAGVLTQTRAMADFYESTVSRGADAKKAANWIMVELQGRLTEANLDISRSPVSPDNLARLIALIDDGTISGKIAKDVLNQMFADGSDPDTIVREKGLSQISDAGAVESVVREVVRNNPDQVAQFRAGKEKVFAFLVGQVMKASRGKANPALVNDLLRKVLNEEGDA